MALSLAEATRASTAATEDSFSPSVYSANAFTAARSGMSVSPSSSAMISGAWPRAMRARRT